MNRIEKRVGWIGLGKMGGPMARRVEDAGFALGVYNRTGEKTKAFGERGIKVYRSPRELAEASDFIFTMIADDSAMESISFAKEGVLAGIRPGTILIDMSTISPQVSEKVNGMIRQKRAGYLRGPVSGSTKFAEAGALTIFASGPKEIYERCTPLLQVLGQKIIYLGPDEEARYMKLLVNMMVGTTSMMIAEALTFGKKSGIDWGAMLDAVQQSVVASPLVGYKIQPLKDRNFNPAFAVSQISKDFDLALSTGRALGVPLPLTSLVRQFYESLKATGRGEMDFFALVLLLEELAGIEKKSI